MATLKEKADAVARELGMEEGLSLVQVVGRGNEALGMPSKDTLGEQLGR